MNASTIDNVSTAYSMIYKPKHFILQELVPPSIYNTRGESAQELLDSRLLITLDQLREVFGPLTVNNWHTGGNYSESGLRSFDTKTGAKFSQHKFGRAADCKFKNKAPREAAHYVLAHRGEFPYLTTIENPDATPTWLHVDVRNHGKEGIWVVNP